MSAITFDTITLPFEVKAGYPEMFWSRANVLKAMRPYKTLEGRASVLINLSRSHSIPFEVDGAAYWILWALGTGRIGLDAERNLRSMTPAQLLDLTLKVAATHPADRHTSMLYPKGTYLA